MCLYVSYQKDIEDLFSDKNSVTLYKVFRVSKNKELIAPYRGRFIYQPGINIAKGKLFNTKYSVYGGAIHVATYSEAETIRENRSWCLPRNKYVIVPVTCYKKDYIATGTGDDFAFKRIFISKSSYDKALKDAGF